MRALSMLANRTSALANLYYSPLKTEKNEKRLIV
jgi:hypothetical protein